MENKKDKIKRLERELYEVKNEIEEEFIDNEGNMDFKKVVKAYNL